MDALLIVSKNGALPILFAIHTRQRMTMDVRRQVWWMETRQLLTHIAIRPIENPDDDVHWVLEMRLAGRLTKVSTSGVLTTCCPRVEVAVDPNQLSSVFIACFCTAIAMLNRQYDDFTKAGGDDDGEADDVASLTDALPSFSSECFCFVDQLMEEHVYSVYDKPTKL
jgi:hypothetical protein